MMIPTACKISAGICSKQVDILISKAVEKRITVSSKKTNSQLYDYHKLEQHIENNIM